MSSSTSTTQKKEAVLIVFTKTPRPGEVKTRLGKTIGMENSCQLYSAFLKDIFNQHQNQPYDLILFSKSPDFPREEYNISEVPLKVQKGKDLGEKLFNAFEEELKEYKRVIIIGTDMPHLSSSIVKQAIEKLQDHDTVIGPTDDGGYYLIGLKKPHTIFGHIEWSTETVFQKTIEHIKRLNLTHAELEKSYDLDGIDEVKKFYTEFKSDKQVKHSITAIQKVL